MFVSSMCQMSFLPYTQSYMGTGINFQPAPIFRTGVIHFCHPGPFWKYILPFSYTSKFLQTVLLQFSFYSLISQFSCQYFQECTLTLFIPNFFWANFIELYCYTFLLRQFFLTFHYIAVTLSLCYGTLLSSSSHVYYSLSCDQCWLLL